jgi:peptide/nickel transport system permease protein
VTLRWLFSVALHVILVVFLVATFTFFILHVLPGDPAALIAGMDAQPATVEHVRTSLGLDQPVVQRYFRWLSELAQGRLGISWTQRQAVEDLLRPRLAVTMRVAAMGLLYSLVLGFLMALLGVTHAAGRRAVRLLEYFFFAFPQFWFALMLLYIFAVRLGWFPLIGIHGPHSYVLPATALALGNGAVISRTARGSLEEMFRGRHVTAARSLGIPRNRIFFRHIVPMALVPVISVVAIQAGYLLAGAIVVEQVFSIPGLGRLAFTAIQQRDLPVIQGTILVFAVVFPLLNGIAELLIGYLMPHLRRERMF